MRALILAAGRGSRMGRLGESRPKCLVELGGRPLLAYQVAALRRGGAAEIGIVRGYRAEMLDFPGFTYFSNARWANTNMVSSLAAAADWLRAGPVIVSYADIFYRGDVVRALTGAGGELVITFDRAWRSLWARRFADPLADAETFRADGAGRLREIGGRTQRIEDIEGQYMGLLKFTPTAWGAVETLLATLDQPVRDRLDMTGLLRCLLAADTLPIATLGTEGHWGEIDNGGDVELYQSMLSAGELALEEPAELPRGSLAGLAAQISG
jgi:L-glutamine-phosphate cytidylyltransferase